MRLLDLLYPKALYCIACGRPLSNNKNALLCEACLDEVPWVGGRLCAKCGKPLAEENTKALCRDCAGTEHLYRRGFACARYAGLGADLVRDMKYRGKAWYAEGLSAFMARRYLALADPESGELPDYDYVVPAPMARRKRERRGYDQAVLLARGLAGRIHVPCSPGALVRSGETQVMSSLGRDARLRNLSGAIRAAEGSGVAGKRILLVDDVYTTGATADACAGALRAAGAEAVDIFTFATGADGRRAGG
ncbi:MAG: ComF family protein [Clostridiales Family XIII bacterium]|jgi:ComF family protein|nr:ComF family protein [Clostridiales Family XIII bacterium]